MSTFIRAHFDGQHLVPEEPVDFPVGAPLWVEVGTRDESVDQETTNSGRTGESTMPDLSRGGRPSLIGILAGKVWMSDDFDAPLDEFEEYR